MNYILFLLLFVFLFLIIRILLNDRKLFNDIFNIEEKYNEIVLIEYPKNGFYTFAYITNKIQINLRNYLVLFIPTNNFKEGITFIVKDSEVIFLKDSNIDVMTLDEMNSFIKEKGNNFSNKTIFKLIDIKEELNKRNKHHEI